ncbi:MAG: ATP-binding protein [Spirochaetota bacterium]|nr:ATP-binding protein [Spirochaetota bacterium]
MKQEILIVEDEVPIQELIIDLLTDKYLFTFAKNISEAKKMLNENSFDLLLLDVMLPFSESNREIVEDGGYQIAEYIQNISNNNIPFIFLSAKGEIRHRIHGMKLGADDYIPKPFNSTELLLKINKKLHFKSKLDQRDRKIEVFYHNLINPAGAIKTTVELLRSTIDNLNKNLEVHKISNGNYLVTATQAFAIEGKMQKLFDIIEISAFQIVKMADNLREVFSNVDNYELEIISVSKIIKNAIDSMKYEHVEIKCDNIHIDKIMCNEEKVKNVICELIDNAILHNSNDPIINIRTEKGSNKIIVYVSDNGRGIEKSNWELAFEQYWTGYYVENHSRGQGLGLWVSRRNLEHMGEKIWIEESEISKGTTFAFSLTLSNK